MAEILKAALEYGILGAVALVAILAAYVFWKKYTEVQDSRIQESNDRNLEMLALATDTNKALDAAANAMLALKDVVRDKGAAVEMELKGVNSALDDLKDAINMNNAALTSLKDLIITRDRS